MLEFLIYTVIGTISGLLSGLVGGVMLMVLGLGLTAKRAVSTTLAVVLFTVVVATGFGRFVEVPFLIMFSMVGAWLVVKARDPLPDDAVGICFRVFVVAVSPRILAGEVRGL